MKNKAGYVALLSVLLLALALTGCPQEAEQKGGIPSTSGAFTLTEAGSVDNKYAFVACEIPASEGKDIVKLLGIKDAVAGGTMVVGVKIQNGQAKIPLYIRNGTNLASYSGNDKEVKCTVYISDDEKLADLDSKVIPTFLHFEPVSFENGKATQNLKDATNNSLLLE